MKRLDEERERAARVRRANELFASARVPGKHQARQEFACDDWQAKRERIASMLGQGFIVMLTGDRGRGKTQMATELIRECCQRGRSARYVKAMEFFLLLRRCYKPDAPQDEWEVIREFCKPGLLVIDAMEERGESEWEDRILNHVIDRRYDEGRDTLLVSNLAKSEFETALGPSIVSRASECGGTIVCDWQSFRGAA